jgi:hypothetical protein
VVKKVWVRTFADRRRIRLLSVNTHHTRKRPSTGPRTTHGPRCMRGRRLPKRWHPPVTPPAASSPLRSILQPHNHSITSLRTGWSSHWLMLPRPSRDFTRAAVPAAASVLRHRVGSPELPPPVYGPKSGPGWATVPSPPLPEPSPPPGSPNSGRPRPCGPNCKGELFLGTLSQTRGLSVRYCNFQGPLRKFDS